MSIPAEVKLLCIERAMKCPSGSSYREHVHVGVSLVLSGLNNVIKGCSQGRSMRKSLLVFLFKHKLLMTTENARRHELTIWLSCTLTTVLREQVIFM